MATAGNLAKRPALRKPQDPFYFNTSESLLRIGKQKANTLSELLAALQTCPDDSIFQHTFRTLQQHHFIPQGFSNDFAQWSDFACSKPTLAEQFASVDIREFTAIEQLRRRLVGILDQFLRRHNSSGSHPARKLFHFCSSEIVVLPTSFCVDTLPAFLDGLNRVPIHSIQHHFIEARLRLHRMSNDFSEWLREQVGLSEAADEIERINIYDSTMEEVRRQIARIVSQTMIRSEKR